MSSRFEDLIQLARQGSDSAVEELVETYQPHILRAVRRKLAKEIRSKFDSFDFVQAVWASVFRNQSRLLGTRSSAQLIGLLTTMGRNKVVDEVRRRMNSQKYNVRREKSLDPSTPGNERVYEGTTATASQIFIAREKLETILAKQTPINRRIILLRLDGLTHDEIAMREGVVPRTVRRVLKNILDE